MTQTPNFGFDYLVQGQANAETTINSNLYNYLDALVAGREAEAEQNDPPVSPSNGQVYLVGSAPTGAWASQAGNLAIWFTGWSFVSAKAGLRLYIKNVNTLKIYNGSAWVKQPVLDSNDALEAVTRFLASIETAITADSNKDQANATQLSADKITHVIETVAATNDAVKLPTANQKEMHIVVNHGANDLQIFPASGDSIERLATDAATVLPPGKTAIFVATAGPSPGNWGISLGGGAAGGITNSNFSENGELLVGDGASSFTVLAVPASSPGTRLLRANADKTLSWAEPSYIYGAVVETPDTPTVTADSKTWFLFDVTRNQSGGMAFDPLTGRFSWNPSINPDLIGFWKVWAQFYFDTAEGSSNEVEIQYFDGDGSLAFTEIGKGIGSCSSDAIFTFPAVGRFEVKSGFVAQVGFELASGNGPHGGSKRHLYNQVFFEKLFPV